MKVETQQVIGLQKPDFAKETKVFCIERVTPNSFDERKIDVWTDGGVLRCFAHEVKHLVKEWGDETELWKNKNISVGVEEYQHKEHGKQYRWRIAPVIVVEELIK